MGFEVEALIGGLILGSLLVFFILRSRMALVAERKARDFGTELGDSIFRGQRDQLENSIRAEYRAKEDSLKVQYEARENSIISQYQAKETSMKAEFQAREDSTKSHYEAKFEEWKITEAKNEREDALTRSRSVLKGKIGEQIAPLLEQFRTKYEPSEARFLGSPIDYVIFRNLSKQETGEPIEIILLDVKTGSSTLNSNERRVKNAVLERRIKFDTLRFDVSSETDLERTGTSVA